LERKQSNSPSFYHEDDMIHKKLDLIISFSKVAGCKNQFTKSAAFLYTNTVQIEKEYRKIIPIIIASK
jgi:hypothetical protein